MSENILAVKVYGREYRIKCPPEQATELKKAANHLDEQMQKIANGSQNNHTTADNIAVVAALNICHEMMNMVKQRNNFVDNINQRLHQIQQRITKSLDSTDKKSGGNKKVAEKTEKEHVSL